MPTCKIDSDISLIDILLDNKLISSKGEGKRLISQNAVKINGEVCDDTNFIISSSVNEHVIKVGKRRFLKVLS